MELQEAIKCLHVILEHKNDEGLLYTTLWANDYVAIETVLEELDKQNEAIKNYKNTIEVIEDLGQMKIEKQIELAKQKWGDK